MVANSNKARTNPVKALMRGPCSECGGKLKRTAITQTFENEGVKIRVSGVQAWVCGRCSEIYFEPGGADNMADAVRSLFALARAERQHKGTLIANLS